MIRIIVIKELKAILQSPKFTVTFAVCVLLMLLSAYVGVNEYRSSVRQYDTAVQLVGQEMREQSSWMALTNRVYRRPDPMQVFASGVNYDIGRWSNINQFSTVKLRHSVYSDDPIFAVFRFVDFTFIVTVVLSLFALLFTYDAISGEREAGTLQLSLSNPVSRVHFITGKFVGSWLGLVIPLTMPIALVALMVAISGIPFESAHWIKFGVMIGVALLYFTVFIALGLLVSALTRHSRNAFLIALVVWVVFVLILPRTGVIIAAQFIPVPTVAEVEGQQDAFAKQRWQQLGTDLEHRWQERQGPMNNLSKEEREQYRDDHLWKWMEEDDAARKVGQQEIDAYAMKLNEHLRNRQAEQQRLAFILSRVSPSSSFQLAVMNIASTNIDLKARYEDAMNRYREGFNQFVDKKQKESGGVGGIRITFDSDQGFKFDVPRERGSLDLSDIPKFLDPHGEVREALGSTIIDVGTMALCAVAGFAFAFVAFLRYDVR
jgi:ABC-type transport system involved in multi-copper enzyme maturation permease subunit